MKSRKLLITCYWISTLTDIFSKALYLLFDTNNTDDTIYTHYLTSVSKVLIKRNLLFIYLANAVAISSNFKTRIARSIQGASSKERTHFQAHCIENVTNLWVLWLIFIKLKCMFTLSLQRYFIHFKY